MFGRGSSIDATGAGVTMLYMACRKQGCQKPWEYIYMAAVMFCLPARLLLHLLCL